MPFIRRSQSALEYMMTYGWAILVIVIVAAVLYSLGIFSPSSSLSTTITGFSNLGTVNAVCLGGTSFTISMGDSTGYPINVTEINLTSSSGKTTYNPNIIISPNTIQTVTVPSSTLCTAGARYSVSAVITYMEPGQIFPGPYTSTGTVAGTANSPPSSATSYEPLTITNSQNQGTQTPSQQMINVTSSSPGWAEISSSPFGQNVEFFSSTGQILDSWLENYTSTHAIWWVKLTASIPAGSSQTIYMGFAPTSTNLFNTNNIGEAPQLSSTYAGYDDGVNVFNYYNDFSGTTLTDFLVTGTTGYTITVNNGLFIQGGSSNSYGVYLPTNYNFTKDSVFSYYLTGFSMASGNYWIGGGIASFPSSGGTAYIRDGGLGEDLCSGIPTFGCGVQYGNTLISTSSSSTTIGDAIGLNSIYDINLTYLETINPTGTALWELPGGINEQLESPFYWEIGGWNDASGDELNVSYTYVRSLPPNGIMPSVTFGSVS